jgi:hypothetical protein
MYTGMYGAAGLEYAGGMDMDIGMDMGTGMGMGMGMNTAGWCAAPRCRLSARPWSSGGIAAA